MEIDHVKNSVITRFLDRCAQFGQGVTLLANPTEELVDAYKRKRKVKMHTHHIHKQGGAPDPYGGAGARARLEENYLYDTRRFPIATDNILPAAPNIAVGDHRFFSNALGQPGNTNGFPNGFTLQETETNMDVGGQIAQGKSFVFNQVGVSFNCEAAGADIEQMLDSAALRFSKQGGQYTLKHGPLKLWPGGTGVAGYAATTVVAANIESAHNGSADIRATRRLYIPRILKEKEVFAYIVTIPRLTKAIDGTDWDLSAFLTLTIWLWGGQRDTIPV